MTPTDLDLAALDELLDVCSSESPKYVMFPDGTVVRIGSMTPTDWENVARCARERERCIYEASSRPDLARCRGEWESWQAAQALSRRSPF